MTTAPKSLIFFDIDGTLLTFDYEVPESAVRAIKRARENGHICVINSGRPYTHIDPKVRSIGFDGYICSCGMNVILDGRTLFHKKFDPEFSHESIAFNREQHTEVIYESEDGMSFDRTQSMNPYMRKSMEHFGSVGLNVDLDIDAPDFYFDKFSAWLTDKTDEKAYKEFVYEHFDPIIRGEGLYEIVAKGCSKKSGMDLIMEETGIPWENTYAIGDSTNDLPMLENCAHSIAMGNSQLEVLEIADHITADILDDGVEKAMHHYGLI